MYKRFFPLVLIFCLVLPFTANALGVGDTIPSFSGTDLDGKPVDMAQVIGKQPVMLIFWASWCPNCKREVPEINKFYDKYGPQGMAFIGINVGFNDSIGRARAFMKITKMAYPVLFDAKGTLSKEYKVRGVPTVIVADKQGKVVSRSFGAPEITDKQFKQLNR
ncbi:MAG TPA: TlpA family protein disulfide reductase [Desulfobulbus sp.]|nr:TlpA family protein disulfide reductase [Desulfobulbus sp.]